jgi:hypothetical protein
MRNSTAAEGDALLAGSGESASGLIDILSSLTIWLDIAADSSGVFPVVVTVSYDSTNSLEGAE